MRYENRALRDLARDAPCLVQIPGICNNRPETSVWAHSNQARHGHGMGIKAHDVFGAICCSSCHAEIDHGKQLSQSERQEYWQKGFERTLLHLFRNGMVSVYGRKQKEEKPRSRTTKIIKHPGTI